MFQPLPAPAPQFDAEAAEIERFRARHRRLHRGLQPRGAGGAAEALDVDGGRARKISAKWRQKTQRRAQQDDGVWPQAAGTEMHMGFNAFDFSSSPEAFCEETELQQDTVPQPTQPETEEEKRRQHMAEVAKQVTAMGFNSASLWEQSLPGLRQPGGPIRQLPTFGNTAQSLWMPPVHHHRCDDKLQPLQHPPRYYG